MKSVASLMIVSLLVSLAGAESPLQPQWRVQPQVMPTVRPHVVPQNPYYFGMHLQAIPTYSGTALRVTSITPGGPAARAGLEIGDVIQSVNGRRFSPTSDSYAAVRQLNRMVLTSAPTPGPAPAPAPAAASASAAVAYYPPAQPARSYANMNVINVRDGRHVSVTVYPTVRSAPAIAPAAPAIVPAPPAPAAASRPFAY